MANGNKYMVYTRDEGGRITRKHRTVVLPPSEIKADYTHRETLMGWPETTIFWPTPYGVADGLAPISAAAKRATA